MRDFKTLYETADLEGKKAAAKAQVVPMVVSEHKNMLDDTSPVKQNWFVAAGACGFAWVTIRPGNSPFANWLKKNGLADKSYEGGVKIWISAYNQSVQLKEAYAGAFAAVLNVAGVNASSGSRLD